jgi:hypothetical protein
MPTLAAIIEFHPGDTPSWLPAVSSNPPTFVAITANPSDEDFVQVLHTASLFNAAGSGAPWVTLDGFTPENISAIPGGLVAKHGKTEIFPSCCCGLESWREWVDMLKGNSSPWLGHDPSPFVEPVAEGFRVWPDGGLGEQVPDIGTSVLFTREQLSTELSRIETDLAAFLNGFEKWCGTKYPINAAALVAAMKGLLAMQHT